MNIKKVDYIPPMHEMLKNAKRPGSVILFGFKEGPLLESYPSVSSPDTYANSPILLIDGVHLSPYIRKQDHRAIKANLDGLVATKILVRQFNRAGFHRIYHKCYKARFPDNPEFRLDVYYLPRNNERPLLCLAFNPANMNDDYWEEFHQFCFQIFNGDPLPHLSKSHVSLIDVAIDFPSVNINDLSISSTHYTDHDRKRKSGSLIYESFGARSSLSRIKVYDKAKQLKFLKKSVTHNELTRFEATIKGSFPLKRLRNVPNRLKRLTVIRPHVTEKLRANEKNLLDAIQLHGAQEVIDRYSDNKTRANKRKFLKTYTHAHIDFAQIWEQQWPTAYRSLRRKIVGKSSD